MSPKYTSSSKGLCFCRGKKEVLFQRRTNNMGILFLSKYPRNDSRSFHGSYGMDVFLGKLIFLKVLGQ